MKMHKLVLWSLSLCCCLPLSAQTSKEEALKEVRSLSGLFYAYPAPTKVSETPAPAGYKPFYISHYGRHGSRWIDDPEEYKRPLKVLRAADKDNCLTTFGKSVKNRFEEMTSDADGRYGQLTFLGVAQHRGIAERMYAKYHEVFEGKGKRIESRSTLAQRCILSMAAFDERLKELNPSLKVTRETGSRFQDYLAYRTPEAKAAYTDRFSTWYPTFDKFKKEHCHPDRLLSALFTEKDYCEKNEIDKVNFFYSMYILYNDAQDIDVKINFSDLFTADELWDLWQVENVGEYFGMGSQPVYGRLYAKSQLRLLDNFIKSADEAIRNGYPAATLRFGHDSYITPLSVLMGLKYCESYTTDYENLYKVWTDFKISPMGANLQWIFYRNAAGEILVKILLNEREMAFNELKSSTAPYYKWSDLRAFLMKKF